MKKTNKIDRQEILLKRLRAEREKPDAELWDEYLTNLETPLKESMASPSRFERTPHNGGVFDRSPSLTSQGTTSAINRILSDMPDLQQRILRMTFWDGMTEPEIASVLGISRRIVSYQKHAAIRDLRQKCGSKLPISEGVMSFSPDLNPKSQINKPTNEGEEK